MCCFHTLFIFHFRDVREKRKKKWFKEPPELPLSPHSVVDHSRNSAAFRFFSLFDTLWEVVFGAQLPTFMQTPLTAWDWKELGINLQSNI